MNTQVLNLGQVRLDLVSQIAFSWIRLFLILLDQVGFRRLRLHWILSTQVRFDLGVRFLRLGQMVLHFVRLGLVQVRVFCIRLGWIGFCQLVLGFLIQVFVLLKVRLDCSSLCRVKLGVVQVREFFIWVRLDWILSTQVWFRFRCSFCQVRPRLFFTLLG